MALEHWIRRNPTREERNQRIVADIRAAANVGAPIDHHMAIKRKAAEISTAMALIHGGDWRVVVDHETPMVLVRRA